MAITKTVTPPVDAAELVTILLTLGACAVFFGAAVLFESNRIAATFGVWAPTLFIVGALCAVGALIIRSLQQRQDG